MKARPILFSSEMVAAILADLKTETRRVIKPQPDHFHRFSDGVMRPQNGQKEIPCPYGVVGDRLWVRETCIAEELPNGLDGVRYMADNAFVPIENTRLASERWIQLRAYRDRSGVPVSAIHMPRWASRITLEITGIEAQRLQDMTDGDACLEGVVADGQALDPFSTWPTHEGYLFAFRTLWDKINGHRGFDWNSNPYVWAVSFRRI